jgi:hypothetical protein
MAEINKKEDIATESKTKEATSNPKPPITITPEIPVSPLAKDRWAEPRSPLSNSTSSIPSTTRSSGSSSDDSLNLEDVSDIEADQSDLDFTQPADLDFTQPFIVEYPDSNKIENIIEDKEDKIIDAAIHQLAEENAKAKQLIDQKQLKDEAEALNEFKEFLENTDKDNEDFYKPGSGNILSHFLQKHNADDKKNTAEEKPSITLHSANRFFESTIQKPKKESPLTPTNASNEQSKLIKACKNYMSSLKSLLKTLKNNRTIIESRRTEAEKRYKLVAELAKWTPGKLTFEEKYREIKNKFSPVPKIDRELEIQFFKDIGDTKALNQNYNLGFISKQIQTHKKASKRHGQEAHILGDFSKPHHAPAHKKKKR